MESGTLLNMLKLFSLKTFQATCMVQSIGASASGNPLFTVVYYEGEWELNTQEIMLVNTRSILRERLKLKDGKRLNIQCEREPHHASRLMSCQVVGASLLLEQLWLIRDINGDGPVLRTSP